MGRYFVTIDRILFSAAPQFPEPDLVAAEVGRAVGVSVGFAAAGVSVPAPLIVLVKDRVGVRVGLGLEMVEVADVVDVGLIELRSVMSSLVVIETLVTTVVS